MSNNKDIFCDAFCGAGGVTEAIESSEVGEVRVAINHDERAIACHSRNHPEIIHLNDDIRKVDPFKMAAEHPEINALWWSPECTHLSGAKGGDSRCPDSRMLVEDLPRHVKGLQPEIIYIENVREFLTNGPVREKRDADGNIRFNVKTGRPILEPDPQQKGLHYHAWVQSMKALGYDYDYRLLNSADFGAYTSRTRYFGIFVKKGSGRKINWPEATHSKAGSPATMFKAELPKWKACRDILDLDDKGQSILFERHASGSKKKVLSANTLRRIKYGIQKYWKEADQLVDSHNFNNPPHKLDRPLGTKMASRDQYLLSFKFLAANYTRDYAVSSINSPLPTISTVNRFSMLDVSFQFLASNYSSNGKPNAVSSLLSPLPTVTTKDRFSMLSVGFIENKIGDERNVQSITKPLGTILTNPKQSLVQFSFAQDPEEHPFILELAETENIHPAAATRICGPYRVDVRLGDIHYRMLKKCELKRAMGFREDYLLDPKSDTVSKKFIGNSVEINVVRALIQANAKQQIKAAI